METNCFSHRNKVFLQEKHFVSIVGTSGNYYRKESEMVVDRVGIWSKSVGLLSDLEQTYTA